MHTIKQLPKPFTLARNLQSFAVLTEILSHDVGEPFISFKSDWKHDASQALIDNYQGDWVYFGFSEAGSLIEGAVHDCRLTGNETRSIRLAEDIPQILDGLVGRSLFSSVDVTFNGWWIEGSTAWAGSDIDDIGDDSDGADVMMHMLVGGATTFKDWAEENYEMEIEAELVELIFSHEKLNDAIVKKLNPRISLKKIEPELKNIGFPR